MYVHTFQIFEMFLHVSWQTGQKVWRSQLQYAFVDVFNLQFVQCKIIVNSLTTNNTNKEEQVSWE